MNKEIAEKWTKRLRSGKDTQGKKFLRKHDKLCCLGVLCEIAVEEGVILPPSNIEGVFYYGEEKQDFGLPKEVMKWAKIKSSEVEVCVQDIPTEFTLLSYLNDMVNYNFSQIADLIDEKFSEL